MASSTLLIKTIKFHRKLFIFDNIQKENNDLITFLLLNIDNKDKQYKNK